MNAHTYTGSKVVIPQATYTNISQVPEPEVEIGAAQFVRVDINVSGVGTAANTVTIQFWDRATNSYVDALASAALSANGFKTLLVGPAVVAQSNLAAQALPTRKLKLKKGGTITDTTTLAVTVTWF